MATWILKTEPSTYSMDDLLREKTATWDGVKNPVAIRNIGQMKNGDRVFVYHTGDEKAVVGLASVKGSAYPDPKENSGALLVIDLAADKRLGKPVTLAQIKAASPFKDSPLVRQGRLSVVPCTGEQEAWLLAQSRA